MSPTRPSSPVALGRSRHRAALLAAAALGGAALTAAPAAAAWTPPASLPFEPEALVPGRPGQAAFMGVDEQDATQTLLHVAGSGTLRSIASPVPRGETVTYGEGGAIAFVVPGAPTTLQFGRIDAAGVYSSAGSLPFDPENEAYAVAAAADGSVAVVHGDADLGLHLTLGGAGRPVSDRKVSVDGAEVSVADVASLAGGGFGVVWPEVDADATVTTIAGARVAPDGTVGARVTLAGPSVPPEADVYDVQAPAGATVPTAVWTGSVTDGNGLVTNFVRLSVEGQGPGEILTVPGEVEVEVETRAFPSGRVLVATTVLPSEGDEIPAVKVVSPLAAPECVAPAAPLRPVAAPVAGALALVGRDAAGRILRQDVREDCSVDAPVVGPASTGSVKAAAADAEGSLVVASSADAAQPGGGFTVDDRTAPTLAALKAPSVIAAGDRLVASVDARDAWGLESVTWRLDGRTFDDGPTASGRAPEPGEHRLEVTATDAAGNRSRASADVTVVADGPGAPGPGTPSPGPGADVPLPSKPGRKPRRPGDPTVRIRAIQETSRGWVLRLRVGNASRLRLRLYRERYLAGGQVRRPLTCPARPRPLRRPPSGLRGRTTVAVDGTSVVLRIPRPLADALKKRGRYTLSVVALGKGAKARRVSPAANRSFTAC